MFGDNSFLFKFFFELFDLIIFKKLFMDNIFESDIGEM